MNFSQKNIHLNRALELGSSCNVKQLFLAENPDGSISLRGDLDIREASKRLLKVIRMEDAVKCDWLTRGADIIFVKKFTQPQFLAPKIYAKKA